MNVLVTGASGFLGMSLVEELAAHGHSVTAVGRGDTPLQFRQLAGLRWLRRDLAREDLALEDFATIDVVFHLAAAKELMSGLDEAALLEANELLTLRVWMSTRRFEPRFVFASSQMVYGDPDSRSVDESCALLGSRSTAYACSKVNAENWLTNLARGPGDCIALRFCGFVDGGGNIDYMINRALLHEPIELLSRGQVCRDYLSRHDAVAALVSAATCKSDAPFDAFNVGSGQSVSTAELAAIVRDALESRSEIVLLDKPAPRRDFVFNISKARMALGFIPRDLRDSVRSYARERARIR